MSRWFRLYDTLLDDPKVQRLPDPLFKTWVNLLCLASRSNGDLPCIEDIAFALRLDDAEAASRLAALMERGLIDDGDVVRPHNWSERQFQGDRDPTAADRQRRKRDKDRDVTRDNDECHAHVTRDTPVTSRPPDTDTDTDTERETRAREDSIISEPKHISRCRELLAIPKSSLDDWEREFLDSLTVQPRLTAAQRTKLAAIEAKLAALERARAPPAEKRVAVLEGSEAWTAWQRVRGRLCTADIRGENGRVLGRGWYFPSEFPATGNPPEATA